MLTDNDEMPWGKFQGTKMANVPATYLLWLYDNNRCSGEVKQYIEDNLNVLRLEVNNSIHPKN